MNITLVDPHDPTRSWDCETVNGRIVSMKENDVLGRTGYISGLTGETIRVEIIAETIDGRLVLVRPDGGTFWGNTMIIKPKADVELA